MPPLKPAIVENGREIWCRCGACLATWPCWSAQDRAALKCPECPAVGGTSRFFFDDQEMWDLIEEEKAQRKLAQLQRVKTQARKEIFERLEQLGQKYPDWTFAQIIATAQEGVPFDCEPEVTDHEWVELLDELLAVDESVEFAVVTIKEER